MTVRRSSFLCALSLSAALAGCALVFQLGEVVEDDPSAEPPDGNTPDSQASVDGTIDSDVPQKTDAKGAPIVSLAAGQAHACAVREDGTMLCWGNNDLYQLGTSAPSHFTPEVVPNITSVKGACAGLHFTCAVQENGNVRCWGSAADGRIGLDPATLSRCGAAAPCSAHPVAVRLPAPAAQVACNLNGACARLRNGDVYCWGSNAGAILGKDPATVPWSYVPSKIELDATAVDLAIGIAGNERRHACVATSAGDARCWGHNAHFALGVTDDGLPACNGPTGGYCTTKPQVVRTAANTVLDGVTSIAAGLEFGCALRTDRSVWCWGANYLGGLGIGSDAGTDDESHLAKRTALSVDITAVDSQFETVLAIDSSKQLWAWGNANYGAIGDGQQRGEDCFNPAKTCRPKPVPLAMPKKVVRTATGLQFNLALTESGELWSWGVNTGELGHKPQEEGDQNCTRPGGSPQICNPNPTRVKIP